MTGDEIQRMDDNGGKLLETLVSAFPHHGVTLRDWTFQSVFCSEKPHSIVHCGRNYLFMDRCKNCNIAAPERDTRRTRVRRTRPIISINHCTVGYCWQVHPAEQSGRGG
jgi:hypothetical protein